jgi:hypothetical protein
MADTDISYVEPRVGSFLIYPANFGISHTQNKINVSLVLAGPNQFILSAGETAIHVRCQSDDQLSVLFQWLIDVLVSKIVTASTCTLMLVRSSGRGTVVLAQIEQRSEHEWEALMTEYSPETGLTEISDSFMLSSGSEQECAIRHSFIKYCSWVGQASDWKSGCSAKKHRLLVKVDPAELWFLRFPLGMYCHFELGQFCRYDAVQWIVSDRTVSQVVSVSQLTETALSNVSEFLAGAYVIINTYEVHLNRFPDLRESTDFLLDVMKAFRDIQISSRQYGLRWTLNPDESQLEAILLSPETRFVFANFESDGGTWELGDGRHDCWNSGIQGCPHQSLKPQGKFSLDHLGGKLEHIRLLRIFHCNSIANPFSSTQPATEGTLARQLLLTGAWFVEGSVTKERYVDHLCTLLALLLGRKDLLAILRMKTRTGKCDLSSMTNQANAMLRRHGYESLT